jgi:hypothetical protein
LNPTLLEITVAACALEDAPDAPDAGDSEGDAEAEEADGEEAA